MENNNNNNKMYASDERENGVEYEAYQFFVDKVEKWKRKKRCWKKRKFGGEQEEQSISSSGSTFIYIYDVVIFVVHTLTNLPRIRSW